MNDTISIGLSCGCSQGLIPNADGTRVVACIDQDTSPAWCERCEDPADCLHCVLLADAVLDLDLDIT